MDVPKGKTENRKKIVLKYYPYLIMLKILFATFDLLGVATTA